MDEEPARSSLALRLVALAGPASWFLLVAFAVLSSSSSDPDAGWAGLGVLYYSLAYIVLVHLTHALLLLTAFTIKKIKKKKSSNSIVLGLQYDLIVFVILCLFVGPYDLYSFVHHLLFSNASN